MNKIALAIGFAFFSSLVASSLPAGEVLEDVVEKRFPLMGRLKSTARIAPK